LEFLDRSNVTDIRPVRAVLLRGDETNKRFSRLRQRA